MSQAPAAHVAILRIASSHPALPGHFPGRPIVPGVLLLDHVLQAAQNWLARPMKLRSLAQVKFVAPLLPEQEAQIELQLQAAQLRFTIRCSDQVIAQGTLNVATGGST
jgi:3-hydroxyacyl-[acyl-carrier-protein] dehydratase